MAGRDLFATDQVVATPAPSTVGRNLFASQAVAQPVQQVPAPAAPAQDQGFFGNVSEDLAARNKAIQETQAAAQRGDIGSTQGAIQAFGQVAGGGLDIIGEGLSAAGSGIAAITPEAIKKPIAETFDEAVNFIADSDIGSAAIDAIKGGVETYQEWAKENPNASKTLESGVNLALVLAPVKPKPFEAKSAEGAIKGATPELTAALSKGDVLTSDVFPPKTFVGKAFQKISERVPVAGTGKVRATQQTSRVEAVENIAREFGIDSASAFESDIVKGVSRVFKGAQKKASKFRTEAVDELNKLGSVAPKAAIKEIDDQITKVSALGAQGDTELIKALQNIKGELSGDFGRLKDIRTTIFTDISDVAGARNAIKSGGDAVLTKVAGALSKDLDDFAVAASKTGATREMKQAANKWKASNRIFKDNFAKAKETELKRALTKGKLQPEVINTTLKGGKRSELARLHGNLDLAGRKSVRQQILKTALEKSGWPESPNPTIFLNEINRLNNKKAVDIFFKGADRRELDGVKKFLDMTRRAQESAASIASQAEVTGAALIGSTAVAAAPTIATATLVGLGGRMLESKPIRNLLIQLSAPKISQKKAKTLAEKLRPLIIATAASKEDK